MEKNNNFGILSEMKIIPAVLIALILVSCENSRGEKEKKIPATETASEEAEITLGTDDAGVERKIKLEILLPRQYRDWEGQNPANNLTKDWFDLYEKDGGYYLGKANFKRERGYSECSGDSTRIIESKNKTLLFMQVPNLKSGKINALKLNKVKIWPKENLSFHYNEVEYQLRAEGDIISSDRVMTDEGEELYHQVKNYKLYISTKNNPETLFLEEESFNDTFVELLFAGDIDRDGKLDFIFNASRDYEEERVILYLSSEAKEGKPIKKAAEIAIQFDC